MITLITMTQGNPIALKRTLRSFSGMCDEVIIGDLCVFEEDSRAVAEVLKESQAYDHDGPAFYGKEDGSYHQTSKIIKFKFDYIFKHGFASILNFLAGNATNRFVIYMNVGEEINVDATPVVGFDTSIDAHYFDHATDPHHWFRCYDKSKLEWNGRIHEEIVPIEGLPEPPSRAGLPMFRMRDTEKDMNNAFKAKVYNDIKEIVYFQQYHELLTDSTNQGATHDYWVQFAREASPPMIDRLKAKGRRYEAFEKGLLWMYLDEVLHNPDFMGEFQESSTLVNLQGMRKDVL